MRRSTAIVLGGLALLVGGLAAVIFLIPLDTYRGPIERGASAALDRQVHIKGPMRLTVYPEIGISLSDVTIANMPRGRAPAMAEIGQVVVGAKLMPLLSRRLEVTQVVLDHPVIHLETSKSGDANWRFDSGNPKKPAQGGTAEAPVSLNHLRIENGTLTYYSADSGKEQTISNVGMNVEIADVPANYRQAVTVDGALTYNREKLQISGRVDDLRALLRARSTGTKFSIASNVINADFTGTIMTSGMTGALKAGAHSVRSLAAWAGHPLPPGNGLGLLALDGQFGVADGIYSISHAHLAFDTMSIDGEVSVDTRAPVLAVTATATVNRLDVRPYLAPGANQEAAIAANAAKGTEDAPFALGGLKAVNAKMTLVLGGLVLPNFKIDHALVKTDLQDGVLKADMTHVQAYGGAGTASIVVDGSGAVPAIRQTLDVTGLKVRPFLQDALGIKQIESTGAVHYEIASRGNTTKAIARGLSGKGEVRFTNGNIRGVDLTAVARVIQSVVTTEAITGAVGGDAKTEFGQLGGTFVIKDGVLRTSDLKLDASSVQMDGRGDVDFGNRTLEFHLAPKAKKGIPGLKLVDVGLPFYVKGAWDRPSYGPDAGALPKAILNKLKDDASSPIDALTKPGLSLKSFLGGGK